MDLFPSEEMTGPYDLGGDPPPGGVRPPAGGGQRLVVDSLGTLFSQYTDQNAVRSALFRLTRSLKRLAITTLVTAERTEGYGPVARFGVKELVSDSVVLLRNALEGDKRRRTLDLLDMRGTSHHNREFPFTVRLEAGGVAIIPLASIALNQPSSSERISLGNAELDRICGGGLYRDSLTLVGGPLGRARPSWVTISLPREALPGSAAPCWPLRKVTTESCATPRAGGKDFRSQEEACDLRVAPVYPETAGLEDHLVRIKRLVEAYQPQRLFVDSLNALDGISSLRGFKEFVIALMAHLREEGIAVLVTANSPSLVGGESATEAQSSSMTDTIILLRYLEADGLIQRGLTALKMRSSNQDKGIPGLEVTDRGVRIGEAIPRGSGSLLGFPRLAKD